MDIGKSRGMIGVAIIFFCARLTFLLEHAAAAPIQLGIRTFPKGQIAGIFIYAKFKE